MTGEVMKKDLHYTSKRDGSPMPLTFYGGLQTRARVLIIHGMAEHRGRYKDFADFLAGEGLEVYTYDLRGHGENLPDGIFGHFADQEGYEIQTRDLLDLCVKLRQDKPLVVFAHSMGTLFARYMLQKDPDFCDLLILSGAPADNPLIDFAILLAKALALLGKRRPSKLLSLMTNGVYALKIKDRKTNLDWLSFDETNVEAYQADPLCGFPLTRQGYLDLYQLTKAVYQTGLPRRDSDLPIFFLSGSHDPCGDIEKMGIEKAKRFLQDCGFSKVQISYYRLSRHEILNDRDKEQVFSDVLNIIQSQFL